MKNSDQFAIFKNLKVQICNILEIFLQFFKIFGSEFKSLINYEDHLAKIELLIIKILTFVLYKVKEQFQILYVLFEIF